MEKKVHYKMHKVKKQWVFIAVTAVLPFALGAGSLTVKADEEGTATEIAVSDEGQSQEQATLSSADEEAVAEIPLSGSENAEQVTDQNQSQERLDSANNTEAAAEPAAEAVPQQVQTVQAVASDPAAETDSSDIDPANIQTIDGKQYYIQEDGTAKKNFALNLNGSILYFDAETGALAESSAYWFQEGLSDLINAFNENNKVYNESADSIETINDYITADSWYRPQYILQNGESWVASTESDYRPLLMTWWPSKDIQVAYLNYMNTQGLGTGVSYTNETDQASLTAAAQEVQKNIEVRIAAQQSADWLRSIMNAFVIEQDIWNKNTESDTSEGDKDHLQGGALLYSNSDLTAYANSDYRLLNRTPTSQTGVPKYFEDDDDPTGGYEFLLANDIDNSNPVVQAEQLNWLHYLMNYGSIVANDPEANFDGVRIDAVDNVNADLLQIASDYFKAYYNVDASEANAINHLSILEAWNDNDPQYNLDTGGAQLPIDNYLRNALLYALARPITDAESGEQVRSGLEPTITTILNDRSAEGKYTERMANYVFIRAHDSEVQTVIGKIINDYINPNTDGLTGIGMDELKQAFEIYNADMNSADKKYTQTNIPASYSLMLTNKDTITRVYYGDMYTDNGQYMATKSPYYDALETLMKARIKYVAGGQDMAITYVEGQDRENWAWDYNGVLTSVRYGTGAEEATDLGTEETRTQGIAVIISNNPYLQLGSQDTVRVNMGAAHANQAYRPLLLTTEGGLAHYLEDSDVPSNLVRYTDENGYLTFDANDIAGYSQVQVSGYLAVWVPVGAAENQDVRVAASDQATANGQVYQTSAALDSQLIYEGFSNFQDFVTSDAEYTNKLIAENADLFKSWGVTSFELAPQYVSSEDGSFLDSIILNGYAFEDRYDLAMSKNNKYGSQEDLINAIKALHREGIQVIADWVPDQIYNLPGQEVVTATRVNNFGTYRTDSVIKERLYVVNSKTNGDDYQAQYGGAFLDELAAAYPEIFERVQISNGQRIDPSVKITEWKAEYFNGTNILGRGAYYVLQDVASNQYFTLNENGVFLPKVLTGEEGVTGFYHDGTGMIYYSTSGYQAKNAFINENGYYYYFDENGYMATGKQIIDNKQYYFLPNGVQLRDAIYEDSNGNQYYYGPLGDMYTNNYYAFGSQWRYFDADGVMARGLVTVNGVTQYFDENGYQIKGELVTDSDGNIRYFDANSGAMAVNTFIKRGANNWYYFNAQGRAVKGAQTIAGQRLYFDENGVQVKGRLVSDNSGRLSYYHPDSGELTVSRFATTGNNVWYYFDSNGYAVTGSQVINGQNLFFNADGRQVKGNFAQDEAGNNYYYDANSGERVNAKFATTGNNVWYYLDENGYAVTGPQVINGQILYFNTDGSQVKGNLVTDANGNKYYYDADSGDMAVNTFVFADGSWYYFGSAGTALTGSQLINGQRLYFNADGSQVKGDIVRLASGRVAYYDADSGEQVRNRWVTLPNGDVIYLGSNGEGVYYNP
ncbi:glucosyltransferase [Streptococcus chenjunshii]|uniref:dextransucrase n=1 Tax=Streptococcus chenjunshii TaxID=2173853 RepID=A0A372KNX0_9STRE|nr:glycoside hydrolase family 70 protein [Streptococcus chenjunshii]AXQ78741.1 glucosyltransferase [Streptococcus chenjunshii]RFU51666.1 glucosyltransferase [Streptococcus chenjunshii]RFU53987.1 glucosyltransferase [Streptococcus chenjunshii]